MDASASNQILKNLENVDSQRVVRLTVSLLTDTNTENRDNVTLNLPGNASIFVSRTRWPSAFQRFDQFVLIFRAGKMVSAIVRFNADARWQDVDDLTLGISGDLGLTGQWELGEEGCIVRTLPCNGLSLSTSFELDRTTGEYRASVIITDTGTSAKE